MYDHGHTCLGLPNDTYSDYHYVGLPQAVHSVYTAVDLQEK